MLQNEANFAEKKVKILIFANADPDSIKRTD